MPGLLSWGRKKRQGEREKKRRGGGRPASFLLQGAPHAGGRKKGREGEKKKGEREGPPLYIHFHPMDGGESVKEGGGGKRRAARAPPSIFSKSGRPGGGRKKKTSSRPEEKTKKKKANDARHPFLFFPPLFLFFPGDPGRAEKGRRKRKKEKGPGTRRGNVQLLAHVTGRANKEEKKKKRKGGQTSCVPFPSSPVSSSRC